MADRLVNYLRPQRKRTGLSQKDIATLLGYNEEGPVSRHERFRTIPPLLIALSYEVIFQVPVSELFSGLRHAVADAVDRRLAELESRLDEKQKGNRQQRDIAARKLQWIRHRRQTYGK